MLTMDNARNVMMDVKHVQVHNLTNAFLASQVIIKGMEIMEEFTVIHVQKTVKNVIAQEFVPNVLKVIMQMAHLNVKNAMILVMDVMEVQMQNVINALMDTTFMEANARHAIQIVKHAI